MAPNCTNESNSKIARARVTFADQAIKSATAWLRCKRHDDAVDERLWRVHDDLYDLAAFVDKHPGGASWLRMTRGTDITEAFETHHVDGDKVNSVLRKYWVGATKQPRNSKLTFRADGFYQTLKRRVAEQWRVQRAKENAWKSNLIMDGLLVFTYLAAILSTYHPIGIVPASLLMTGLVISGHNYLHKADNVRMYYFNMGFSSFRQWRVTHVLSHHCFPNTRLDVEMYFMEPLLNWWPSADGKTSIWLRYGSWAYAWILCCFMHILDFVLRNVFRLREFGSLRLAENLAELLPFTVPAMMYVFGSEAIGLWYVWRVWLAIVCCSSFMFGWIALNAGHHHPEVFHDGDAPRENLDFGIFQLDTMIERSDLKGACRLAVLTQFGEHILHHLFPTIDHGELTSLHRVLRETLNEFGVESRTLAHSLLIVGQHLQLARVKPCQRLANL